MKSSHCNCLILFVWTLCIECNKVCNIYRVLLKNCLDPVCGWLHWNSMEKNSGTIASYEVTCVLIIFYSLKTTARLFFLDIPNELVVQTRLPYRKLFQTWCGYMENTMVDTKKRKHWMDAMPEKMQLQNINKTKYVYRTTHCPEDTHCDDWNQNIQFISAVFYLTQKMVHSIYGLWTLVLWHRFGEFTVSQTIKLGI